MRHLKSGEADKASTRLCLSLSIAVVTASMSLNAQASSGEAELRAGQRFEIVEALYAHGVTNDLRSREISIVSLVPLRLSGPEIVFRQAVPVGCVMTVAGKAPTKPFQFLYQDRYTVQISCMDAPAGVPVVIDLARGIEGKASLLNPQIFRTLPWRGDGFAK